VHQAVVAVAAVAPLPRILVSVVAAACAAFNVAKGVVGRGLNDALRVVADLAGAA